MEQEMTVYAKVQHKYVWKDGKANCEPIYQNANVNTHQNVEERGEHTYQNVGEEHTYQNVEVNAEEPIYAELSFTPLPRKGKNSCSTNAEEHIYAELNPISLPRTGKNGHSTNTEKHIYAKLNFKQRVESVPEDNLPILTDNGISSGEKWTAIDESANKLGLIQRIKNMLGSIKDFFVNLFRSEKSPINDTLMSVENYHKVRDLNDYKWNKIHYHGSSYERFDNCDDIIHSDNSPYRNLKETSTEQHAITPHYPYIS